MEVKRQGFYKSYSDGLVEEVTLRVLCDGDQYRVTAEIDQMGEDDPNAMFDTIERKSGRGFNGKMGTKQVTAIVTVLEFCKEFCDEHGYVFRGPAVGPKA